MIHYGGKFYNTKTAKFDKITVIKYNSCVFIDIQSMNLHRLAAYNIRRTHMAKKRALIILFLIFTMTMALCTTALADGADDVMSELRELQREYPDNAYLKKLVDDAGLWLANPDNAATITSSVAATVTSEINAARQTAGGAQRLSELSDEQTNAILSNVSAAASAANLKFEASANNTYFVLKDANGREITSVSLGNPIKPTGLSPGITGLIIAGGIITVLAGFTLAVFIPKKRKSRAM